MSSKPPARWDFTDALNLLHALPSYTKSQALYSSATYESLSNDAAPTSTRTHALGNFDNIFKLLSSSNQTALPQVSTNSRSSDSPTSDESDRYSTAASSLTDLDEGHTNDLRATKAVRWNDEVEGGISLQRLGQDRSLCSITTRVEGEASQIRSALHPGLSSEHDSEIDSSSRIICHELVIDFDSEIEAPAKKSRRFTLETTFRTLWTDDSLPQIDIDPTVILPIKNLTFEEKRASVVHKLIKNGNFESGSLTENTPYTITKGSGNISKTGVHIFVDSSNITIGFYNALKKARSINVNVYTKRPPISFQLLALIMERGRTVTKRVLVGSSRSHMRPKYMDEAASCGYEVSSLEPVEKYKKPYEGERRKNGSGYGTSGQSSGSEAPSNRVRKVTEQGVDEILHMKMLESIVDTAVPSTIILASGDAAEAEYSSGFLKNVERALEKGWKVEIVSWRDGLSYAYRSRSFLKKWKAQFRIIELDQYSEELLAIYA